MKKASQGPDERWPSPTKQPHTYTNGEKEHKNTLQCIICKKGQKSTNFNALERKFKSKDWRWKKKYKRMLLLPSKAAFPLVKNLLVVQIKEVSTSKNQMHCCVFPVPCLHMHASKMQSSAGKRKRVVKVNK